MEGINRKSKQGVVIHFGEDGQFAADGRIQHFAACFSIGFTRKGVADFGGVEIGKLPFETFGEVVRRKMIRVIALRNDGFVRVTFRGEVVIHADENDLFETHVKSQLQRKIGDGCALPHASAHIRGKTRTCVRGVKKRWNVCKLQVFGKVTMRTPCKKFRHGQREDIVAELLNDQVVDGTKIRGVESELGEQQINAIHTEGEFVLQFGEVGLFQAGTVANDEGALAFVNILERGQAADAFAPPRMQVRVGQLRDAADGVVGISCRLQHGFGQE